MQLTPLQRQLLLTAMDPAAAHGEHNAASGLFFQSLRKEYPDGYALLAALAGSNNAPAATPAAPFPSNRYSTVRMPFGKHKGQPLSDIEATYLLWVLDNVTTLDRSLRRAIERHLQDEQYAN